MALNESRFVNVSRDLIPDDHWAIGRARPMAQWNNELLKRNPRYLIPENHPAPVRSRQKGRFKGGTLPI